MLGNVLHFVKKTYIKNQIFELFLFQNCQLSLLQLVSLNFFQTSTGNCKTYLQQNHNNILHKKNVLFLKNASLTKSKNLNPLNEIRFTINFPDTAILLPTPYIPGGHLITSVHIIQMGIVVFNDQRVHIIARIHLCNFLVLVGNECWPVHRHSACPPNMQPSGSPAQGTLYRLPSSLCPLTKNWVACSFCCGRHAELTGETTSGMTLRYYGYISCVW